VEDELSIAHPGYRDSTAPELSLRGDSVGMEEIDSTYAVECLIVAFVGMKSSEYRLRRG
jgi:hypothetical protein